MTQRYLIVLAGLLGALAVAFGAWAAHGMEAAFGPRSAEWARTGASYQVVHALGIIAALWIATRSRRPHAARFAAWCFAAGAAIFPGTLYGLALGAPGWLGAVTPVGGLAFIFGWLALVPAGLGMSDRTD